MLSITIDWLAGTFKEYNDETENFIRAHASAENTLPIKPRNGYSIAQQDGNGVQLLWNSNNNWMGYHVIFTGSSLRNVFERDALDPLSLLRAAVNAGIRISRLDLAKDLTGQEVDGQTIFERLKSGLNGGTARSIRRIENEQGGQTIYVGSRTSERYIRIYDKAQETGDTSKHWWRMEVETKGETARLVSTALVEGNRLDNLFDGLVLKMVGQPTGVKLDKFFTENEVPSGIPKIEKRTDREKWIAEQVIAAIAAHYIANPSSEAIAALRNILDTIDRQRKI